MKDDKLWKVFSKYIRLKYADKDGDCTCFTCEKKAHWKEMQAGHFVSRRHQYTKYDLHNVHPQCPHCNLYLHGNQFVYGLKIDQKYGPGTADGLMRDAKKVLKRTKSEIDELTKWYKDEITKLEKL